MNRLAKKVFLLNRQSDKSYGFFIPNYKENGEISGGHGVYWFPKSLVTSMEPTGKLFFKEIEYVVIAPEWLFKKQNVTDYEIVEMPVRGSK